MSRSRIIMITTAAGFTLACSGVPDIDPTPPPRELPTLYQNADGICELNVPYSCPPPEEGMTCNPPPIREEPCPPLASVRQISRQPDGTCQATGPLDCPEAWSCTSDGTVTLECPPQLGESERIETNTVYGCTLITGSQYTQTADCPEGMSHPMQPNYRIEVNEDGSCTAWFTGASHCPEGASCNPPPPRDVACPPELIPPAPG
ncbi:MAG: hypothetical protein ACI8RZ_007918 [Myxococcota bacterium]|jgi:hypothetical protein